MCTTAPASCFNTADALGNVGQLGHEYFSPSPDSPALQAILIFEDAPLIYFRNYGWGTLDNLDVNTSHPVLTVRPDSPALQAILILEDAPLICFRNYGLRTLDNLDMNTSHSVLTVRPDSPAL